MNLKSTGLTELEINVLGQRKSVARSSFKRASDQHQDSFQNLLKQLEQLMVP